LKPLSWYKSLHDAKGRREAGAFLVEGVRAIDQISSASPASIQELLYQEDDNVPRSDLAYPVRWLTPQQFKSVCLSRNPSGPLAVVALPKEYESASLPADRGDRILICEDIQDPGNIGTLIRTAAGLDFSGVVLNDKCADPFGPKAVQASAGAILSLRLRRMPDLSRCIKGLVNTGFSCIAADLRGAQSIEDLRRPGRFALVLGNEGNGLSQETLSLATHVVKISINPRKAESLNVAASGAICMYALTKGNA
jgi:TrmH family RNA methyltransferase